MPGNARPLPGGAQQQRKTIDLVQNGRRGPGTGGPGATRTPILVGRQCCGCRNSAAWPTPILDPNRRTASTSGQNLPRQIAEFGLAQWIEHSHHCPQSFSIKFPARIFGMLQNRWKGLNLLTSSVCCLHLVISSYWPRLGRLIA